jgi:thioredoxin-related protein
MADMRARTAFVIFLAAIVTGGLAVFGLGIVTDASLAAVVVKKGVTTKAAAKSAEGGPRWRDIGAALDEAKSSGKPIMVDVYTDWCGWCKRMDRDTYAKPEVKAYLEKSFVPVRLNAESSTTVMYLGKSYTYRELAGGFRINSYPTTMFLGSDGKHLASAPGYMGAGDFLTVLRYFGDGHFKSQSWKEYQEDLEAAAADSSAANP